jgi:hypothetical protein
MAQSRQRHKHGHHHAQHPPAPGVKRHVQTKAFHYHDDLYGCIGFVCSLYSAGPELLWLTAGLVAGIAAGYFIGRNMDNAAGRK